MTTTRPLRSAPLALLALLAPAAAPAQVPAAGLQAPFSATACDIDSDGAPERCWIDATGPRSVLKVASCDDAACRLRAEAALVLPDGVRSPAAECVEGSLVLSIPKDGSRAVEPRVSLGLDGDVLRVRAAGSSVAGTGGRSSFELDFRTGLALWDVAGKTPVRRRGPIAYVGRLPEGEVAAEALSASWSEGWTGLPSGDQVRFLASGDRVLVGIKTAWRGRRPARVIRGGGARSALALAGARGGPVPLDCAKTTGCVRLNVKTSVAAGEASDLPDGEGVIVPLSLAAFLPGGDGGRPALSAFEIVRVGTSLPCDPPPVPEAEEEAVDPPAEAAPARRATAAPAATERTARYRSPIRASDPFSLVRAQWVGVAVMIAGPDRLPAFDGRLPWLPGGW